jgi:hypothetical protein
MPPSSTAAISATTLWRVLGRPVVDGDHRKQNGQVDRHERAELY